MGANIIDRINGINAELWSWGILNKGYIIVLPSVRDCLNNQDKVTDIICDMHLNSTVSCMPRSIALRRPNVKRITEDEYKSL